MAWYAHFLPNYSYVHTVQLSLNFTHVCGYMRPQTRFSHVKVNNLECIFLIACGFVMRTHAIKHLWHTKRAPLEQTRHECMLKEPSTTRGTPHE